MQELACLYVALERQDWRDVLQIDPDAVDFSCPDFGVVYCDRCCQIGPPTFAKDLPGFYEHTEATCPQGHRHIMDD